MSLRILWTSPYLMWPTAAGNKLRQFHLLRGLAAQGTVPTLVVDQMEEAAMLALDEAEGRAFLTLVATAAASAKDVGAVVLASARADLLAPS